MRIFSSHTLITVLAVCGLLGGALLLTSATNPPFTVHDKAYYADEATVNFVRPGLVTRIVGHEIAADGTVKARVRFTDPRGLGLDRLGVTTPGAISCSLMIAYIPAGATQYVSYTTRVQTSPITGVSATQAGADSGGTWTQISEGEYWYTFARKLPANYDRTATTTIGAWSSRNLSEFDLPTNYSDHAYSFVPNGAAVTRTRDVIKTATCNGCHQGMAFHGGSRRSMEVCVLCHTPQTADPDTGETVDMPVMTHKIHYAPNLASVKGGKPYVIIGNAQSVHDYSHVTFPSDARRCTICHDQTTGAAQAKAYYNANRAACGACHDDVNFATGAGHVDMPQFNDNQCTNCHQPGTGADRDASVDGAHVIYNESPNLLGLKVKILQVTDVKPGQGPTVTFLVEDKQGNPVTNLRALSRMNIILAGPNTDYTTHTSEAALTADGNGFGVYWWTLANKLPADAKGSWTVAIEGRRDVTMLQGTAKQFSARDVAQNVQFYFSVDGSAVQSRRTAVDIVKCNDCHGKLSFHGGGRDMTQECAICHRANAVTRATATAPSQTYDFGVMAHRIHRGEALTNPYCFGNTCFNEVLYPGDLRNCTACHVSGREQFPIVGTREMVQMPQDPVTLVGRATATCLSCHDTKAAAAHAKLNTDPQLGETCDVCHGSTSAYSINRVHAH